MENMLSVLKPTFPDRHMLKSYLYPSDKMVIVETSYLMFDEFSCGQYYFLIPLKQAPVVITQNKRCALKKMSIFPCNPGQSYRGEKMAVTDFKSLVVYMDNTLIRSTAEELFGISEPLLKNCCFALTPALRELLNIFIRECSADLPGVSLMQESIALQVAVMLLRESCLDLSGSAFRSATYYDDAAVKKAIEYITDNYQNNLTLAEIANVTHYSPYHFLRLFKRHTGITPFEYLLNVRIEKAKDMLIKTDCTMSQICDLCAFGSLSHFSCVFRKKTGVSPTEYKNKLYGTP
ncbi:MAG: helix-turn-helix domain-containing protein [Clostridia bacterium]|jgi:AraC family transcriptional regulator